MYEGEAGGGSSSPVVEDGLGCGLLAKVTTEAYIKVLQRGFPAFAAFFPAKSKDVYLLKVSIFDENQDVSKIVKNMIEISRTLMCN
jgi:predicted oxidoreductase (fatty acid repression mutant protein)